MGIGSFKIEDGNPFRSASQGNTRKPTVPDLRNYLTYEANMFEHYETIDGRDDRPSSRTYSKSRSEKLAPLNISKSVPLIIPCSKDHLIRVMHLYKETG